MDDLISVKAIKEVPGRGKKLITTCIFMPENPSVSMKTSAYITGLIKNIETFRNSINKEWILRVYFDDMYISSISKKTIETAVKKSMSSSVESPNKYAYNDVSSVESVDEHETIHVKLNIKENKNYLKKSLKLLNLYLNRVRESDEYDNIELFSFKCPEASLRGGTLGHSETFGSIMRFLPLYDDNVDVFFCINSRYTITPMLRKLIEEWDASKKSLFTFEYHTGFIQDCIYNNFDRHINKVKKRTDTPNDTLFTDVVNGLFTLKSMLFKDSSFRTIETIGKDSRNSRFYRMKRLDGLVYQHYISESHYSIAAGIFGIKRNCPFFAERVALFSKLLRYYIKTKNEFPFGIDEVLLKLVIAFEIGTHAPVTFKGKTTIHYNKGKLGVNYITHIVSAERHQCSHLSSIFDQSVSFVSNSTSKKPLSINISYNFDLLDETLFQLNVHDSRSLFSGIKPSDSIDYKICYTKKYGLYINITNLFTSFNEYKKLYLIDSKYDNPLNDFLGSSYDKYYTVFELQEYPQNKIHLLLDELIHYYRKNVQHYHLVMEEDTRARRKSRFAKAEFSSSSSSSSSSLNSPVRKLTKKKQKQKPHN
jgi:hypothetical protein